MDKARRSSTRERKRYSSRDGESFRLVGPRYRMNVRSNPASIQRLAGEGILRPAAPVRLRKIQRIVRLLYPISKECRHRFDLRYVLWIGGEISQLPGIFPNVEEPCRELPLHVVQN